jgi:hypothetical protein
VYFSVGSDFQLSSWTITLDSSGYVYVSWVCQHTFPEHTTAADALIADAARNPAPTAAAAGDFAHEFHVDISCNSRDIARSPTSQ